MRIRPSILAFIAALTVARAASAQTVTIDGSKPQQLMDGWINQMRVWDDPHLTETFRPAKPGEDSGRSAVDIPLVAQNDILGKLYGELGLTHVQAVIEPGAQPVQGGPFNFNWKRSDAHTDYVKQARPFGLQKSIFWNYSGEAWAANVNDPSLQAEWELALLRRWRAQGAEPEYAMVWNEPTYNGAWVTPEYLRELVRLVGRGLAADGFKTKILAPEGLNAEATRGFLQTMMADVEVRGYIAAITTHLYGNAFNLTALGQIRDEFAKPYGKPLWMSEYSDFSDAFEFADLMHELIANYDVSNVAYEWGFFGQWETRAHFITINHDASNNYTGYQREKIYYAFGQFSRFVKAGARRVDAASSATALKVTAYSDPSSFSIVVVNNTNTPFANVSLAMSGLPQVSELQAFRTSASENWAQSTVPVTGASFSADFPAKSITTFTWKDPAAAGSADAGAADAGPVGGGAGAGASNVEGGTAGGVENPGGVGAAANRPLDPSSDGCAVGRPNDLRAAPLVGFLVACAALATRARRRSLKP